MPDDIVIRETENIGKGMFANRDYKKDEIILFFDGEVVHGDMASFPKDLVDHMLYLGDNNWVVPQPPWTYLNHSCEPNAGMRNQRELVAFRDIKKGEQICFDYAMNNTSDWRMECRCGNKNCRKLIGTFGMLDKETQNKYMGYVSDAVKKKFLND